MASASLPGYGPEKALDECFGTRWIAGWGKNVVPTAETTPINWQWTTNEPGADWQKENFATANWEGGPSGFGRSDTPNAIVHTAWTTSDIWMRKEFDLSAEELQRPLQLRMFHDDDAEIYLNGVRAAGWSRGQSIPALGEISRDANTRAEA